MRGLLFVFLVGSSSLALAEPIHNSEYGFSFVVPDGFADFPQGHSKPEMLYAFARGVPGQPKFELIAVQDLGGTIGRDPIDKAAVERGARKAAGSTSTQMRFEFRKTKWRSFDLDLVVTHTQVGDMNIVSLGTQLPFARHAVQLLVSSFAGDEAQAQADLERVLGTFEGKTSWLTDDERAERLGELVGRAVGFLFVAGLAIGLGLWLRRRQRRTLAQ